MKYLILFFLLIPSLAKAQVSVQLFDNTAIKQNIVDTSFIECKYEYKWVKDTLNVDNFITEDDIIVLLIGNKYHKTYSYKTYLKDSMVNADGVEKVMANMKKYRGGSEEIIFKDLNKNMIKHIDKIATSYFSYNEDLPVFNWDIKSDTLNILGYNCIKAECDFRGRKFIAWFSPDVPINAGPWKFNSLPGLIFKVYDINEHYLFNIVGIRNIAMQITIPDKKITNTNRKKYLDTKRNMLEDPIGYLQTYSGVKVTVSDESGKPMNSKETISKMKYGFIELQ